MQPKRTSGAPAPATYRGRTGTFLRTAGWAVLLDVDPGHPLVDLCWDRLAAAAAFEDVLGAVLGQERGRVPGGAPGFVLVRETGEPRVLARGPGFLALDGADVLVERSAEAWVDLPLDGVSTVEAALVGLVATGPALPLRDGVAAATGFSLVLPRPPGNGCEHAVVDERLRETCRARRTGDATLPVASTIGLATAPAPPSEDGGEHPDRTGDRSFPQPDRTGAGAPRVLAAVCPAGHLTAAYSVVCRVCRRPVPAQEAFETARPALGRLVLPGGASVLLDRGAVLGREPHVPVGWVGTQPHLVALSDPDHDVSAQHAAVLLDLWNVSVCDLGSTNGTDLVDEAGRVTPLRPYEPVALPPGSAVVLAEVATLGFEVHA